MRKIAPLLLVLTIGALTSFGLAAESLMLTGKPAEWEEPVENVAALQPDKSMGEAIETPNQRRRRLGVVIEASLPAEEYGIAEETPNHRRIREAQTALAQAQ